MLLQTVRPVVVEWWTQVVRFAEERYAEWVRTPISQRQLVKCNPTIPKRYQDIEQYLSPRFLEALPVRLKTAVWTEKVSGVEIPVAGMLFRVYTFMQPGGMEERDSLYKTLASPNVCTHPDTALKEL